MDKETLINYIKDERARGVHDEDLHAELVHKGWKNEDIVSAFKATETSLVTTEKTLPPLKEMLRSSFDELWKNIWKTLLIMAIPFLALFIFGIASGVGLIMSHTEGVSLTYLLVSLVFLIITALLFVLATIMIVRQSKSSWSLSFTDAFRSSMNDALPIVVVAVLSALAILGGFFLFIIPGLIACLWYAFSQIAVILDGKMGLSALIYSKELVRGRVWSVFLYYLAATILVSIVNMTLSLIPIIGMFISALTTPYLIIFSVHLYLALKKLERKDSIEEVHSKKITQSFIVVSFIASIALIAVAAYFG